MSHDEGSRAGVQAEGDGSGSRQERNALPFEGEMMAGTELRCKNCSQGVLVRRIRFGNYVPHYYTK